MKKNEHLEKQTHKSFWDNDCVFSRMQSWYAYFLLKGKTSTEACKLAANKKGYPKS